ncbi:MAG: hypothetical protein ACRYGP_29855 [Janthinobacterium lividum]
MSFTQNSSAQSRALTAFFDTKGAAQQAVSDIEAAGVPRSEVTLVEGGTGTADTVSGPEHEGFLAWLKDMLMSEEDRSSYAEGLRRGGYLVSVKTERVDVETVLDILDRDGAVDMEQRETTWRSQDWTGYRAPVIGSAASGLAATGVATTRDAAVPTTARAAGVAGSEEVIPVYEERLEVGKL